MKFTGFTHKWFPAQQKFSLFSAAGSPKLKWLAIERSLKSLSSVIFKRAVRKRSGDSHIQFLRSLLAGFCGLLSHPLWQVYGLRTWLHSLAFENYDNKKPETLYYKTKNGHLNIGSPEWMEALLPTGCMILLDFLLWANIIVSEQ